MLDPASKPLRISAGVITAAAAAMNATQAAMAGSIVYAVLAGGIGLYGLVTLYRYDHKEILAWVLLAQITGSVMFDAAH